jgi:hypothetical protein
MVEVVDVDGAFDLELLAVTCQTTADGQALGPPIGELVGLKIAAPKGQLMAYAYRQKGDTPKSEVAVRIRDGSAFLVYDTQTGRVVSEKQSVEPKDRTRTLQVKVAVSFARSADGTAKVKGRTNLPDGMILMITVRNRTQGYTAQDKVSVLLGSFETTGLTDHGNRLPAGRYAVEVDSVYAGPQPKNVRDVIGGKGENLSGDIVLVAAGSKVIGFKTSEDLK